MLSLSSHVKLLALLTTRGSPGREVRASLEVLKLSLNRSWQKQHLQAFWPTRLTLQRASPHTVGSAGPCAEKSGTHMTG